MINVTVWNEGVHEKLSNEVAGVYPAGIHGCIKNFLISQDDMTVKTATLAQRKCGLSDEVLDNTDVLIWWGHMAHDKVPDKIVEKIHKSSCRYGSCCASFGSSLKDFQSIDGHNLQSALERR